MARETSLKMRPTYEWDTSGVPEDFVLRLREVVSFDPAVRIQCASKHCTLSIPEEARHTWSPTLDLLVEGRGERTYVHARMGPEPQVWTFFVFVYAAIGVLGTIGTMWGLAQLTMGNPPVALAALPAAAAIIGVLYVASFVGKGLGAVQIHQLLAVVEATLSVDAEEL